LQTTNSVYYLLKYPDFSFPLFFTAQIAWYVMKQKGRSMGI
jgi:hypothetical protein